MATTATSSQGPPAAFWRKGVEPDESRVPKRAPLRMETLALRHEPLRSSGHSDELLSLVEAREEDLWLTSSDSKFYARWCLHGATPMAKKFGVVLVPGHPALQKSGQVEPQSRDSPLLVAIADACQRRGLCTLRFDYRGVGKSKGTFDAVACVRDAVAAVQAVTGKGGPFDSVAVIAFSFGSAQSLGNVYTKGCTKFVSISHGHGLGSTKPDGSRRQPAFDDVGDPLVEQLYNRTNIFFTTMRITIPKLWIVGEDDPLSDKPELVDFLENHSPGRGELSTVVEVPGAPHDLRGAEAAVATRIVDWLTDPTVDEIKFDLHFASGRHLHTLNSSS
mmetsp:Transcript_37947/g.121763  ORF Transcript_37947/g.121763 Transcript_37947/m.121763 type:complete len:333 (-) Transcript_37947:151-1149(-)